MTRRQLPATLSGEPPRDATARGGDAPWLDVSLPLECITPVIGGGVRTREPDLVDFVRVPGIRGQLRQFWRALAGTPGETAEALFRRERALWGGVGKTCDDGAAGDRDVKGQRRTDAWKSRVVITVEVPPGERGRDVPAGFHPKSDNGRFRAFPKWSSGKSLGYALFPLQHLRPELDAYPDVNAASVPTHPIRENLGFILRFRLFWFVADERNRDAPDERPVNDETELKRQRRIERDAREVLGALWCWVHLGGLGARTTRGFGALAPKRGARLDVATCSKQGAELVAPWQEWFQPPKADEVASRIAKVLASAGLKGDETPLQVATLHGYQLRSGPAARSAQAAHALLIGALQTFRQGEDFARDKGHEGRPGRSRWPEPDALRLLAEMHAKKNGGAPLRWDHPPRSAAANCSPRAAFGLPIHVKFKDKDKNDQQADAKLLPPGGDRFTSPLRLRPIRCADGRFVPIALALALRPGAARDEGQGAMQKVRVAQVVAHEPREANLSIAGTQGAKAPIEGWLRGAHGDAVLAFLGFLEQQHRFEGAPDEAKPTGRKP
jgi:CRISPR-associated protein Cmr1